MADAMARGHADKTLCGQCRLLRVFCLEEVLASMQGSQEAKGVAHLNRVNSLSFSRSGRFLAYATDGGVLQIVDCDAGGSTVGRGLRFPAGAPSGNGCCCATFTPHPAHVLVAEQQSEGDGQTFRAVDYCHGAVVTAWTQRSKTAGGGAAIREIVHSPVEDMFQTSSSDGCVRLWEYRTNACLGEVAVGSSLESSASAYDPSGQTFAVSKGGTEVLLYDSRKYHGGPFLALPLPYMFGGGCCALRYRPQNDLLAVLAVDGTLCGLQVPRGGDVDAGSTVAYEREQDSAESAVLGSSATPEPAWTPDGSLLTCGNDDGSISCWLPASGKHAGVLARTDSTVLNAHPAAVGPLCWSPRLKMAASACYVVALWLPVQM
eukprot:TRINITY_DN44105_c0_g1_i1.p1 TRINITY_DN44105_c0_g1~~TRINITY_DN44105_c0_g1_i1.p1  ORF type:complete len:395 (+),score=106.85 TRINITY_DN44105_c0_g1_i1:61-1185(+)